MRRRTQLAVLGIVLLMAAPALAEDGRADDPVVQATFTCNDDKSINAAFHADKVDLTLSDGRSLELPQVVSGSGARYANADESFVFWNKGDTAFVTEGPDEAMTYVECVATK
jgi:membrane-bound inhibitor of C-type lysozyme